jgi:phosphoribosylamine--glycine ligase
MLLVVFKIYKEEIMSEKFNVLLVGSGGREFAFLRKLLFAPEVKVTVAPGSTGMLGFLDEEAHSRVKLEPKVKANDLPNIVKLAQEIKPDLVVVGPDDPLAMGLADELWKIGIKVFGFAKKDARLEGSKSFCKETYQTCDLPTAPAIMIRDKSEASIALSKLRQNGQPIVLKCDSLALGKGVVIVPLDHPDYWAETEKKIYEMLDSSAPLGFVAKEILLENRYPIMDEWSAMHIVGQNGFWVPLMPTRDHKFFNGLNTGGMGIITPAPGFGLEDMRKRRHVPLIIQKALREKADLPFCGILYEGLNRMLNTDYLVEVNVRGGDPETQGQLEFFDGVPFHELLLGAVEGNWGIAKDVIFPKEKVLVGVVMASKGYPSVYEKGKEIFIPAKLPAPGLIFPAGLVWENGKLFTAGGRVLMPVGEGKSIAEARVNAYAIVNSIKHDGALVWREDIGLGY